MTFNAESGAASPWLRTNDAARYLGLSPSTLTRYRANEALGFEPGVHYRRGPYRFSPCMWNCAEIEKLLVEKAYTDRIDDVLRIEQ